MNITIRPVKDAADSHHIEEIALAAWGCDGIDVIPGHLSLTVAKENGGIVLLCFDDDRPVGFCWSFWAYMEKERKWKCASHQAGVIPEYKGKGIGEKIKWAQREVAREKGFDLMTWTFDPLQTINGSLNIRKLGAVCNTYYQNLYGDLDDDLNRGIPTDRFSVSWWLDSAWVDRHATQSFQRDTAEMIKETDGSFLNQVDIVDDHPMFIETDYTSTLSQGPKRLLLHVPRDFHALKRYNHAAAIEWRLHSRAMFEAAFAAGYSVIDLLRAQHVCYYLFERDWHPD